MILTDFQKQLIQDIAEERITTFDSFLKLYGELIQNAPEVHNTDIFYGATPGTPIWTPKDKNITLNNVKDFVRVWRLLEKANLITRVTVRNDSHAITKIWINRRDVFYELRALHKEYEPTSIIFFPQLVEFIERGFITHEEFKYIEEKKSRERAEKRSIWLPIIVALVSIIVSNLVNYFIYTDKRVVEISNPQAFSDTVKVEIEYPKEKIKLDSKQTNSLDDSLRSTLKK